MNFRLKVSCVILWICLALAGHNAANAAETVIVLSKNIQPYQDALAGFRSVCDARIKETFDLKGKVDRGSEIASKIIARKPDFILAIGSEALLAVKGIEEIPIVFAMILYPESILEDGENITGASAQIPVEDQLEILQTIDSHVERIGLVYDPKNTGSLVEDIKRRSEKIGLTVVASQAGSIRESLRALKEMEGKVDVLMMVPDRTTLTTQSFEYMLLSSFRYKIPLVALSKKFVQKNALFALSIEYEDIGRQAGELANEILNGVSPSTLAYTKARKLQVVLNLKTAQKIGLDIPSHILANADIVAR